MLADDQSVTLSPVARLTGNVLLVDDDRSVLMAMEHRIKSFGYRVETATNGAEAFAMLRDRPERADVVVTDRMMPVMDGLALTRRLKRERETRHLPVVMLTGAADAEDISNGLDAGAFYYLTKPSPAKLIESVLASAFAEVARQRQTVSSLAGHQAAFPKMQLMRLRLHLPEEVDPVVSMVASLADRPERIVQGLFELVQNGVEHGVLRFGLELKTKLMREGTWADALNQRSRDPAYAAGHVEVTGFRRDAGIFFVVSDTGPGFNWAPHVRPSMARSSEICGRGISRAANFAFDSLKYNKAGNQAVAFVAGKAKVKW